MLKIKGVCTLKSCPNCNHTFSFSSRSKAVNTCILECSHCNSRYKLKYPIYTLLINIFLTAESSSIVNFLFPQANLYFALIRIIVLAVVIAFSVYYAASYFVKYDEIG